MQSCSNRLKRALGTYSDANHACQCRDDRDHYKQVWALDNANVKNSFHNIFALSMLAYLRHSLFRICSYWIYNDVLRFPCGKDLFGNVDQRKIRFIITFVVQSLPALKAQLFDKMDCAQSEMLELSMCSCCFPKV